MKFIPNHIKKFRDPRMRQAIFAYIDAGGDGLDPPVREAILHLKEHAAKKGLDGDKLPGHLSLSPSCGRQ